ASPAGASRPIASSLSRTFASASCSHRRWLSTGASCAAPSVAAATLGSSIRIVVNQSVRSAFCAWYPQMRVWLLNRARCFDFEDDLDDDALFRSVSSE